MIGSRSAGIGARAVRNTTLIMVVRVLSRLLALITVVVMGNALGDTGLGEYQTAITYSLLISVVADVGFSTLYVREGARHPEQIARFLNNMLSVKVPLLVLAALGVSASLWLVGIRYLILPTLALLVLSGYQLMLRNTLYALQRLGPEIAEIIPEAVLLLVLVIAGALGHRGPGYFIWAYAASYLAACAYFVVVLMRMGIWRPRWQFELAVLKPWFRVGLPFAVTYIFTSVYFKLDVPILQHFRPYSEVGWYTFAYKPFEALLFLPMTVRTVVFPVITVYHQDLPARVRVATEKFFKALAMLGLPIGIGTVLLAHQLNDLMHLFPNSEPALQILGFAIPFMFIDNTFAATLNAVDRQAAFAWIAMSGLVINVAINLLVIPSYGYLGAAWSTVATEAWLVTLGWLVLRRFGFTIPVHRLVWRTLVAGAVMGAFLWVLHPEGGFRVVGSIVAAAVIYGAVLWLIGGVDDEERALIRRAVGRGRGAG